MQLFLKCFVLLGRAPKGHWSLIARKPDVPTGAFCSLLHLHMFSPGSCLLSSPHRHPDSQRCAFQPKSPVSSQITTSACTISEGTRACKLQQARWCRQWERGLLRSVSVYCSIDPHKKSLSCWGPPANEKWPCLATGEGGFYKWCIVQKGAQIRKHLRKLEIPCQIKASL